MIYLLSFLAALAVFFGWVVFCGAPYIPSHKKDVNDAFSVLYKLDKSDLLVDLGSGDGRVLRQAVHKGARAIGYEINPLLVLIANCLSTKKYKNKTILSDFWITPLPNDVTVVYAFSVSRDIKRLTNLFQTEANRLGKTISVITYGFELYNLKYKKRTTSHFLYQLYPLQHSEA